MESRSNELNLNDKQRSLLDQFRENVKDVLKPEFDDEYLVTWLRAREWDLKKAEKMFRDNLAWRVRWDLEKILEWQAPEVIVKYLPGNFFGHDKNGCPVWYDITGYVDVKGMVSSASKQDLIRYRLCATEKLRRIIFPEYSKKFGKKIDKVTFIVDMEGFGMKHLSSSIMDICTELLRIYEANYPDTLGAAYVINAPSLLPVLFNIIKPFLAEDTRAKIHFMGKNWKEDLLQHIDAEQLPVHWGGTRTDPDGDPFCKSQICLGGTIPKSYYLKNAEVDLSQYITTAVNRGSSAQLEVEVDQPGSVFSWSILTKKHDIGFGVYRPKTGITATSGQYKMEDMEEIVEYSRVNCHSVPETGTVVCQKAGKHVVWFDNSYSWTNSKKVHHFLKVLVPDENIQA